ncbi:MAG: MaoC family dehydratase [SAR202 cluster bacterium]|nr:MaoC family dehydratase [SAR202 cluster bacterium]
MSEPSGLLEGDSVISPAMRAAIGRRQPPVTAVVERGAIHRFCEAIGEDNPLFVDDEAAVHGPHGGIVAPPTFLRSIAPAIPPLPDGDRLPNVLDGGSAWTYGAPVRPGDRVTASVELNSLAERSGRLGPMVIATYATEYRNQHGELVATQEQALIRTGGRP